ncbi:hypothetical protein ACQEUU_09780 [Nonomuraea sp. CA-218870]
MRQTVEDDAGRARAGVGRYEKLVPVFAQGEESRWPRPRTS